MKFYYNLINSINGLKEVLKEHSFIYEVFFGVFIIFYLSNFNINSNHKILIIFTYLLLLVTEIINTTIEKICDKITKKIDPEIKVIKDLSSAAVFVVLFFLVILLLMSYIK